MLNWFKYSGFNITLKLNPFHWRFHFKFANTNADWSEDTILAELGPFTVRIWFNNGDW